MNTKYSVPILLAVLMAFLIARPVLAQNVTLEEALGDMYRDCLFGGLEENNPFSQAVGLATQSLAPGFSNFIESNLAAIPLAPPSLDAEFREGEVVTTVAGFTPVFTESSATVGKGQFLVGSNVSYLNLTKIRGQNLSDIGFTFEQNGGGDLVVVNMPLRMSATVFTLYGTYGITNRLDIGVAVPVLRLRVENEGTLFRVEGDRSGCRYSPGDLNCEGRGSREALVSLNENSSLTSFGLTESHTYLSTLAVRAKYRLPFSLSAGSVASVLDMRIPTRPEGSILGSGNFGARLTLIGEYNRLSGFKPYVNLGGQYWDGDDSSSLKFAAGFNQRLSSKLFFAFDLLGELDLEDDPFLASIDNPADDPGTPGQQALGFSTIPAVGRDHSVNAGLGVQLAFSPSFHTYGSALFSLLDRGLQSTVVPTAGAAFHF